jgi:hypothetical protein
MKLPVMLKGSMKKQKILAGQGWWGGGSESRSIFFQNSNYSLCDMFPDLYLLLKANKLVVSQ